jgi:hypothetical protein
MDTLHRCVLLQTEPNFSQIYDNDKREMKYENETHLFSSPFWFNTEIEVVPQPTIRLSRNLATLYIA